MNIKTVRRIMRSNGLALPWISISRVYETISIPKDCDEPFIYYWFLKKLVKYLSFTKSRQKRKIIEWYIQFIQINQNFVYSTSFISLKVTVTALQSTLWKINCLHTLCLYSNNLSSERQLGLSNHQWGSIYSR